MQGCLFLHISSRVLPPMAINIQSAAAIGAFEMALINLTTEILQLIAAHLDTERRRLTFIVAITATPLVRHRHGGEAWS